VRGATSNGRPYRDTPSLSTELQQRVALARALVTNFASARHFSAAGLWTRHWATRKASSHETCMGLSPVKGLFALAGQLICDCCLGFADSSLFGAEKAVLRPVAYDQVPGARGRGQGTETLA